MSTNKGYADEHWSVGENPQFMFGSDDLGIINTDELKTISNEDLLKTGTHLIIKIIKKIILE